MTTPGHRVKPPFSHSGSDGFSLTLWFKKPLVKLTWKTLGLANFHWQKPNQGNIKSHTKMISIEFWIEWTISGEKVWYEFLGKLKRSWRTDDKILSSTLQPKQWTETKRKKTELNTIRKLAQFSIDWGTSREKVWYEFLGKVGQSCQEVFEVLFHGV